MRNKIMPCAIAVALALTGCNSDSSTDKTIPAIPIVDTAVLKFVDPMIGTAASGHTFPGATVPSGMVQLSPDTFIGTEAGHEAGYNPWHSASGYWDPSDYSEGGEVIDRQLGIYGFSHTHLSGTGASDLGDILILPYSDDIDSEINTFDKKNEDASAGYYTVTLNEGDIKAELTTTKRVGHHKYTFAQDADRKIKVDIGHTILANNGESLLNRVELVDKYTLRGRRTSTGWFQGQDIFFYAKFNEPVAEAMIIRDGGAPSEMKQGTVYGSINMPNADQKVHLDFGKADKPLEIRVALSPVSWDGARNNLEAEAPDFDFAKVKRDAEYAWAKELSRIKVKGGSEVEKTNFYTGMYHMMIAPIEFYDVDGRYRDMLGKERRLEEGDTPNYSIYSTWDTFRAVHPLWTIIDPEQATNYAEDLIRKSNEFGLLPKWEGHGIETGTMIGYPAAAIVGDAVTKGLVDAKAGLDASIKSAYYRPYDFPQIPDHTLQAVMAGQLSYHENYQCVGVPNWNSVSYALEFSYYDWTIAEMAKAAGETDLYDEFKARSYYSLNHWDAEAGNDDGTGFFVPVEWQTCEKHVASDKFDPYHADMFWYTEGNAWQWQWAFMQDLDKLTEIMGGTQGLNDKLNNLFNADPDGGDAHQDMTGFIGQYIHGNEPSHHVIYLYNRTEESYKAQEYLDQVYDEFYKPTPDGIIGNEDVGQMSAWYIMSTLGFYQISPTDPTYTIGRPIFDQATMTVDGGSFRVIAENNGPDNLYVKSVTINGKPLDKFNTFKHEEFKAGGELRFVMTSNKSEAMAANL
ncbi:alpha-mannosidase [Photobacterium lutimaris]|uniref:Alpha-mannosidase n=2 Tax=Photobacterium lutimaris TaxID=388278 RepID=A0A2T3IK57_9GAMM|nr:GH92 family glycosyl hydrolase [Photobacterium lutimaris]PSU28723.1 alpha-mannosidase [Photobacterium lutimaris]TDR70254.1 putative alpha-1,2-mannosidase [Photobacterium lutimaris]